MGLLDVVFPAECAGCGARGAPGCSRCIAALSGPAALAWPSPPPPGLPPPWSVVAYSGVCRDLLIAYKERGAVGLRRPLAVPLATALLAAARATPAVVRDRLVVVPVPSTGRAVRARGDDVVLALTRGAASIARRQGLAVRVLPVLRHGRVVADSSGLSAMARAANLAGAFVVRPRGRDDLVGAPIVIADDLMTTGASLAEATRALTACGATVVGAATIAATRRRTATAAVDAGPIRTTVGAADTRR